jgi:hypothetical protein
MIEKAIVNYLNNHPTLTAYKGKIYYHRVPTDVKMPFVICTNAGGGRTRISAGLKEPFDTLIIYVESQKQFEGYDLANLVNAALDNYRGNMGDAKDLVIKCDTPRDLDGFFATYRYMLSVHVKYTIPFVANNH